jgi:stress-induced morphogen
MVNDALKEELKSIHALSLKTWTPEQWEKKKSEL